MITRFAPTPSGYLHLGNAVNLRLASWLATQQDGQLALRIDDMDLTRARSEYVDDIFDVLAWLGIEWTHGPRDHADFDRHHRLSLRTDRYRRELTTALAGGLDAYACACSRARVASVPTGGCPAGCRQLGLDLEPGRTALRAHVRPGTTIAVDGEVIPLDRAVGDFVLWRRDDLPSYHLASVVEDRDLGATHLIRGRDLLPSTAAQLFLAPYLDAGNVRTATLLHHDLVVGPDGTKLSKSRAAAGPAISRDEATRERITGTARALGEPLGIRPPELSS